MGSLSGDTVSQHRQQCHTRTDSTGGWAWSAEQPLPPFGLAPVGQNQLPSTSSGEGECPILPHRTQALPSKPPTKAQCLHQPRYFGATEDGTATRRAFLSPWKC